MRNTHQSRKVRDFLAKKKLEQEAALKQELEELENKKLDDNTVAMSMQLFYDITINKCSEYLQNNETIATIKILKKMLSDGYDIDYILIKLLANGNTLFFQFIKQVRRDLINHFEAYDEIVNNCKAEDILTLLKYDILELEHAQKVNKMATLETTIYMFLQLTYYEDSIKTHLFSRYASITSEAGLFRHWLLVNIPHEVAIYLKSLKGEHELNERLVNFNKILHSYRVMEINFKGSPMLKGRLINIIRMVVSAVLDGGMSLPSRDEFTEYFNHIYIVKGDIERPLFIDLLCWDAYWYIDCLIMAERAKRLFPYEQDNIDCRWSDE